MSTAREERSPIASGAAALASSPEDNIASDPHFFIRVAERIPLVQDCYNFCVTPSCGAVSSFVGITRDTFQSKRVVHLSYEAYVPMATKVLKQLCQEVVTQYGVTKVAAVHVLGDCPVGQPSVILVTSSPHRRASLQAVEYLIDQLKARVPIWKREVYDNDPAVWKENVEWKEGKQQRVMIKEQSTSTTKR